MLRLLDAQDEDILGVVISTVEIVHLGVVIYQGGNTEKAIERACKLSAFILGDFSVYDCGSRVARFSCGERLNG